MFDIREAGALNTPRRLCDFFSSLGARERSLHCPPDRCSDCVRSPDPGGSQLGTGDVLTGIESINRANLKQIHKSWNTVGIGYDEALKIARDNGIAIVGSFILGMDEDTPESLNQLLEFAIRERFFAVLFNLLTPYPGTVLYKQFLQDGRLTKPQWWLDADYTYGSAVFKPKNVSAYELEQGRMRLYREFYSPASMLRRLWEPRANLQDLWHAFTFLTMNLPANKEEQMRFGKTLGAL